LFDFLINQKVNRLILVSFYGYFLFTILVYKCSNISHGILFNIIRKIASTL